MTAVKEEIARFQMGLCRFVDLSKEAQEEFKKTLLYDRCGFEPDLLVRASGVTNSDRQAKLAKCKRYYQGKNTKVPVRLVHEDNKFDPHAIAVYLPSLRDKMGDWVAWEHIGYIPRGRCPACGATITGPQLDKTDTCPKCNFQLYIRSGDNRVPANEEVEFNTYILGKLNKGLVQVGLDNIIADPNKPQNAIGISIAIKVNNEQPNTGTDTSTNSTKQQGNSLPSEGGSGTDGGRAGMAVRSNPGDEGQPSAGPATTGQKPTGLEAYIRSNPNPS